MRKNYFLLRSIAASVSRDDKQHFVKKKIAYYINLYKYKYKCKYRLIVNIIY